MPQCQQVKDNGQRCGSGVVEGTYFCLFHQKKTPPKEELPDSDKIAQAANQATADEFGITDAERRNIVGAMLNSKHQTTREAIRGMVGAPNEAELIYGLFLKSAGHIEKETPAIKQATRHWLAVHGRLWVDSEEFNREGMRLGRDADYRSKSIRKIRKHHGPHPRTDSEMERLLDLVLAKGDGDYLTEERAHELSIDVAQAKRIRPGSVRPESKSAPKHVGLPSIGLGSASQYGNVQGSLEAKDEPIVDRDGAHVQEPVVEPEDLEDWMPF